ncbi:hypothetical protein ETB97_001406 [Aspergillus alliaceus]|uniref:Cytochrome b-c1 complex subunit 8 n=1 Tax=Petromyces alliaceus TaxID=209559 RepID=A0A8H6A736_PETAA|nr:hypothetical protein ETB97_001406 [Aspergillus burnettii]
MVGHVDPKNGYFIGPWGDLGCPTPQRIASYSLSPNRQRPLAGTAHAAFFNTFRRFRHQVLYVAPPFIIAYAAMNWAIEKYALTLSYVDCLQSFVNELVTNVRFLTLRNHYLNSKPGRLAEGGGEE